VDDELQTIIERALSFAPEDRYETALAFQTDLDQYLGTLGGVLRDRDIGRALSKMFDDVREERRQTIERQLARSDTLHDIQLNDSPLPELTSFSNVQALGPVGSYRVRPGPRSLVVLALLAMSIFAATIFWPSGTQVGVRQSATNPKPPVVPAVEPLPAKPQMVSVHVAALPTEATISLDGVPLPSNPHAVEVRRDRRDHELVVNADGYVSQRRFLVFSRDQELLLTLAREPSNRASDAVPRALPPTKPSRPAPAPAAAPKPGPDAPEPRCSTPFYYDSRGIKKYRPECL
jgi:serine/threonine-protein kinase